MFGQERERKNDEDSSLSVSSPSRSALPVQQPVCHELPHKNTDTGRGEVLSHQQSTSLLLMSCFVLSLSVQENEMPLTATQPLTVSTPFII